MATHWRRRWAGRHEAPARWAYVGPGLAFLVGVLALVLAGPLFTAWADAIAFCPSICAHRAGRALQIVGAFYLGVWWGRR